MKLSCYDSIEDVRRQAQEVLKAADTMQELLSLEIPGEFVFSPPRHNRLVVNNLDDLHTARTVLKKVFGWEDHIDSKFSSCGLVIVTYKPNDTVKTPLPFDLWVQSPPETFPEKLLGGCKVERSTSEEYRIVCPIQES
jgi:hypothetical protein